MLILIIFLPLIGFLSGSLFGGSLGIGVCFITTFCIFISFINSLHLFINILVYGHIYKLKLGNWIPIESLNIEWCFLFDSLTSIMLVIVTLISTLVHLYSISYMENDPHLTRFMSYLSLFTFFMLILVTSNNFLQMFVGWEGVGLCSYLLINFWFTRIQANKAAIKAMLINRIGDFFILLALFSLYYIYNSLDYETIFTLVPLSLSYNIVIFEFQISIIDLVCIFLFIGAMGKSAQIGLHTWLPDAMEGPTPVSALIHAATMVTAGVFLITRCSFLFEYSTIALNLIMFIGALTAFFAATTGLFQNDLKKVIAYSTCSQLGYMIFACGLSSYDVGIFHLSNHAFFKALLFLGAGSIIHALSDEQDMRKMGGLKSILPYSYATMLIGSVALIGFPFLSGFYSKDTILEIAFAKQSTIGHFCYYLGSIAAFCTAFYSTRLLFLVFLIKPNCNKKNLYNAHEGSWKLTLPLFILSLFSILIGFLTKELFIGFGTHFWNGAIFILPKNYILIDIEFINIFYKILPLLLTISGVFLAYFIYSSNTQYYFEIKKLNKFKTLYNFFNKKWYLDRFYNEFVSQLFLNYSYQFSYKDIDRGLLEIFGPSGIINILSLIKNKIKFIQSGNIFHYLLFFLVSIIIIFFLSLFLFSKN
jgi:proton-translocating NADH-quinone oxidoreductase chain L